MRTNKSSDQSYYQTSKREKGVKINVGQESN